MGAVPSAEMMDVMVEKLFSCRHFWREGWLAEAEEAFRSVGFQVTHVSHGHKVFNDNNAFPNI